MIRTFFMVKGNNSMVAALADILKLCNLRPEPCSSINNRTKWGEGYAGINLQSRTISLLTDTLTEIAPILSGLRELGIEFDFDRLSLIPRPSLDREIPLSSLGINLDTTLDATTEMYDLAFILTRREDEKRPVPDNKPRGDAAGSVQAPKKGADNKKPRVRKAKKDGTPDTGADKKGDSGIQ